MIILQKRLKDGNKYAGIDKRAVCPADHGGSGSAWKWKAGKDKGHRKKTGNFWEISGADCGSSLPRRLGEEYTGESGGILSGKGAVRIYAGDDSAGYGGTSGSGRLPERGGESM